MCVFVRMCVGPVCDSESAMAVIIIILFIYNALVPVLKKRAPNTVQLHISGSIHS